MHTDKRKNCKVYNFSLHYFKPTDNKCDYVGNEVVAVTAMYFSIIFLTTQMNFGAPMFSRHTD